MKRIANKCDQNYETTLVNKLDLLNVFTFCPIEIKRYPKPLYNQCLFFCFFLSGQENLLFMKASINCHLFRARVVCDIFVNYLIMTYYHSMNVTYMSVE